ncbi:hypothetical protein GEMRC1_004198 [Eukaryota sp. GEM-RC1]
MYSDSSFMSLSDIIVHHSIVDCLVSLESSSSNISNCSISDFLSNGNSTVFQAMSSSIIVDFLYLDNIRSSKIMLLSNSSGLLSDSSINNTDCDGSMFQMVDSKLLFVNGTTSFSSFKYFVYMDSSILDCHGLLVQGSELNSFIQSTESIISLSQFKSDVTNFNEVFTKISHSFMNSSFLTFVNSVITTISSVNHSLLECRHIQLHNVSFTCPIVSSLFHSSDSELLLSNVYGGVIDIPVINSTNCVISCFEVQFSCTFPGTAIYVSSSDFRLFNSDVIVLSNRYIYSFDSELFLQGITISCTVQNIEPLFDLYHKQLKSNLFDLRFSNITVTDLFITNTISHHLFFSDNSRMNISHACFSNIFLTSAVHCMNTIIQLNNFEFEDIEVLEHFITLLIPFVL